MAGSKIKEITLLAILASILIVQKLVLAFIPNVTLTVFLLILYSKKLGFVKSSIITLVYVIVDNLVMGSFNIIFTPFMLIGWMFIPILTCTIFKKVNNPLLLGVLSILYSLLYSWVYIIPNVIFYQIDPIIYWLNEIIFEIPLIASSFISTIVLYYPLSKLFDDYLFPVKKYKID